MGQKTSPIGLRLGIIRGWDANWFEENAFAEKLSEDIRVRTYIKNRLKKSGVSRIVIERTTKILRLTIHSSRPGMIIGRSGQEISKIEEEIRRLTNKEVKILISEIKKPELDALLVAENIALQIEGRVSFRKAMKQAVANAMRMGAVGIKVMCSGRLGGAEMARSEQYKDGRIPLHTLRADIDYGYAVSQTIYGSIGVKVWICRGEIFGKPQLG